MAVVASIMEELQERRARQHQAIEERRFAVLMLDPQMLLGLLGAQENFTTRTSFTFEGIPEDAVAVAAFVDPSYWGIGVRIASMTFAAVPLNQQCPVLNVLVHASTRNFVIEQMAARLLAALEGRFRPDEVRQAEDALRTALLPVRE
jgi:hypothetical protein